VTPVSSVDAVQARSIRELDAAVATKLVGTVGGCVSGRTTVTVTADDVEPAELVAVTVYVVVRLGATSLEARPVTSPTPLSMDTVGAGYPETDHDRVVD
jgi:hypothetical protein